MGLKERIGVDVGRRAKLEDGIAWAAKHGVRHIDIQLDTAANALTTFDDRRAPRHPCVARKHGIRLGLHTPLRGERRRVLAHSWPTGSSST